MVVDITWKDDIGTLDIKTDSQVSETEVINIRTSIQQFNIKHNLDRYTFKKQGNKFDCKVILKNGNVCNSIFDIENGTYYQDLALVGRWDMMDFQDCMNLCSNIIRFHKLFQINVIDFQFN